jgi:hypothetical protein
MTRQSIYGRICGRLYGHRFYRVTLALSLGVVIWLSNLTPVLAAVGEASRQENRRFLPISAEFIDSYTIPKQLDDQSIGGLSALAYDRRQNQFYALSDDRNSPHLIRFNLDLTDLIPNPKDPKPKLQIQGINHVETLTLTDPEGNPQPPGSLDPEGLALTPGSIYISSEGDIGQGIAPALVEFDRQTGQERRRLPIALHYLPPNPPSNSENSANSRPDPAAALIAASRRGIQPNLGFESLSAVLAAPGEPVRLFTATEAPLLQDLPDRLKSTPSTNPNSDATGPWRNRLAHYSLLGDSPPLLIAEHLYPLDRRPRTLMIGLSDILALDNAGHFLAIERALAPTGFQVKLYQIAIAGASDISGYDLLQGSLSKVVPIAKQLLLDLNTLPVRLDNLEGLTLGPILGDGSQSLLLIADDNFNRIQRNQLLLFRLGRAPKEAAP